MSDDKPDDPRLLMMAFLDDELDEEERRRFLERCWEDPQLARELASYKRLQQIADSMVLREPEDHELERVLSRLSARIERRFAFLLLASGALLLLVGLLVEVALSDLPPLVKIGVEALALGGALLAASVFRVWRRLRRLDRYQGVKR